MKVRHTIREILFCRSSLFIAVFQDDDVVRRATYAVDSVIVSLFDDGF